MTPRCDWCGCFIRKDTQPFQFLNALSDTVERMLCLSDLDACKDLAARNLRSTTSRMATGLCPYCGASPEGHVAADRCCPLTGLGAADRIARYRAGVRTA